MTEKLIAWVLALTTTAFVIWTITRLLTCSVAYADDDDVALETIADGIRELQPGADVDRSERLAVVFSEAGQRYRHDPLLLVAISFRESSLLESVESRRRRGSLGELGLMQCHGRALTYRPADCDHHLIGAYCQVETGAAYLAQARDHCGGSWWRWVAAYGMGHCPSEGYARTTRGAQNANRYYNRIGGASWARP